MVLVREWLTTLVQGNHAVQSVSPKLIHEICNRHVRIKYKSKGVDQLDTSLSHAKVSTLVEYVVPERQVFPARIRRKPS